ncbi:polyketide synthase PKS [Rhexocercosporidium sp. MPI-PUGE-AT-0058]|nr:polyketide synthase PKS [Rhexocercosporidium sp. MPI-PUGE-AT-0058]
MLNRAGCRFSGGASGTAKLWELLRDPIDVVQTVPSSRFDIHGFAHPDPQHHGTTNSTKSYFLEENHKLFDAGFFKVSQQEAEAMDPQHRMLLEIVYEALEDAGISLEATKGTNTALFVGQMTADYHDIQLRDVETMPQYAATGLARSITSNRVSYFYDWRGLSMTIDTACSSSLVAVHEAVQVLRRGESDVAVAAGCTLILGPEMYVMESKLHLLSPTGHCHMWDARADGYTRGEGFGVVILKTLSKAIKDGDHIQSIIRETGVNSDGRTTGITMPSSSSQAALIQATYERAGLDITKASDRCQYFEAHGTGTPVGDPIEASAIQQSFFPPGAERTSTPLYVGSIKTIIGHTEGAAGVAGVLKASLLLQKGRITPNLHFDALNPDVRAFYGNLQVPRSEVPWPAALASVKRCSVNSFGFGGTNAHAILESYHPEAHRHLATGPTHEMATPLVLSAATERSLVGLVDKYQEFLEQHPDLDVANLRSFLQARRSSLPTRISFSGQSIRALRAEMLTALDASKKGSVVGTQGVPLGRPLRVLGVFTGQGAQWATMGRELLRKSWVFRNAIELQERSLGALPDAPSWSLSEELVLDSAKSRMSLAEYSQPLCTAVQIALVELLSTVGISFAAVVGHSSGEIAAAYAAGHLSAQDAIRIAFYRGKYSGLASGADGKQGGMMAVGMSLQDAVTFCNTEPWTGEINVAASNGLQSVTLSGNLTTLRAAKKKLDQDKTPATLLRVDKAYHSSHMLPCVTPYLASLVACNITLQKPQTACLWISSVTAELMSDACCGSLRDEYWVKNLVQPVVFLEALQGLLKMESSIDVAIEVGPHPALRTPASQILAQVLDHPVPYYGTLSRLVDDTSAICRCLGLLWQHTDEVNFARYKQAAVGPHVPASKPVKSPIQLPTYSWEHSTEYWRESAQSVALAHRPGFNVLLGVRVNGNEDGSCSSWRNILRLSELPWLREHCIQGQVILPAAAYCSMALEAAMLVAQESFGHADDGFFIELHQVHFQRAVVLHGIEGAELMVNLSSIKKSSTEHNGISADFSISSRSSGVKKAFNACHGQLTIHSRPSKDVFPPRKSQTSARLSAIPREIFYDSLTDIGLEYGHHFRLDEISRFPMHATASVARARAVPSSVEMLLMPPPVLDLAFQSAIAAFAFPGDGGLRCPYVPTFIRRLSFDTRRIGEQKEHDDAVYYEACVTGSMAGSSKTPNSWTADINTFYGKASSAMAFRVDGLKASALAQKESVYDEGIFTTEVWAEDIPDGLAQIPTEKDGVHDASIMELSERLSYCYMKSIYGQVSRAELISLPEHFHRLWDYLQDCVHPPRGAPHPAIWEEWAHDSLADVLALIEPFQDRIEFQIIRAVGEALTSVIRDGVSMLEVLLKEDHLFRLYTETVVCERANGYLAKIARIIAHRYPRCNILEVGAGTGGATKAMQRGLDGAFHHYHFTDISPGFFNKARETFQPSDKFTFQKFNVEEDATSQGFVEGSFDIVVASNVIHATRDIQACLRNVRRLLKPGGYLLLMEVTADALFVPFIMSAMAGWWLHEDDLRKGQHGPLLSPEKWKHALKASGFSGIDYIYHDMSTPSNRMNSVIVSQAVNDDIQMIRQPLSQEHMLDLELTIVGGEAPEIHAVVEALSCSLSSKISSVLTVPTLELLQQRPRSTRKRAILLLADLDSPILKDITPTKLSALQDLFEKEKNIFWITRGRRGDVPYSNMSVGLGRCLLPELVELRLQFLDLDVVSAASSPARIAEVLMRFLVPIVSDNAGQPMLWTAEPELAIEHNRLLIPRLRHITSANDRYLSQMRSIHRTVSLDEASVTLEPCGEEFIFKSISSKASSCSPELVRVRLTHSISTAVRVTKSTYSFLCLGTVEGSGKQVLFFAGEVLSAVCLPVETTVPCEVKPGQECYFLSGVLGFIIASEVFATTSSSKSVLILEPNDMMIKILQTLVDEHSRPLCIATRGNSALKGNAIQSIHPLATQSFANNYLEHVVGSYIHLPGFTSNEGDGNIGFLLPRTCLSFDNSYSFLEHSHNWDEVTVQEMHRILTKAASRTEKVLSESGFQLPCRLLPISQVDTAKVSDPVFIWDWTKTQQIEAMPLIHNPKNYIKSNQTYLLAGLTSSLGLSLAWWMVQHGARHIALTSRSPQVSPTWVKEMASQGVQVEILPMDITDAASVSRACKTMSKSMPPVGGVIVGAMILKDSMFFNMTAEKFQSVVDPKVSGAFVLDQQFFDVELDFFIFLSSISSVVGNSGQSNYCSGNMYAKSLIAQRRKRGFAASILDLGIIFGVGFFVQADSNKQMILDHLYSSNCVPLSEADLHASFFEAIIAAPPSSGEVAELSTGLVSMMVKTSHARPRWYDNPRFLHLCSFETPGTKTEQKGTSVHVPVKKLLETATTPTQAKATLVNACSAEICTIMQLPESPLNVDRPLIDLGVDSLIAVDIRSWFFKELAVSIPVLDILSGKSISDICQGALVGFK